MYDIVTIAGSPSKSSKTLAVLEYAKSTMKKHGLRTKLIPVRDLPPEDLVLGNFESPALQKLKLLIEQAGAVIIATPVYKASYPGVLKALLDLLPQNAFSGKVILPIAIGGTIAHLLSIEYAMKPLFSALGAEHILKGVYIVSTQMRFTEKSEIKLDADIEQRLQESLYQLASSLKEKKVFELAA